MRGDDCPWPQALSKPSMSKYQTARQRFASHRKLVARMPPKNGALWFTIEYSVTCADT